MYFVCSVDVKPCELCCHYYPGFRWIIGIYFGFILPPNQWMALYRNKCRACVTLQYTLCHIKHMYGRYFLLNVLHDAKGQGKHQPRNLNRNFHIYWMYLLTTQKLLNYHWCCSFTENSICCKICRSTRLVLLLSKTTLVVDIYKFNRHVDHKSTSGSQRCNFCKR